MKQLLSIFIAVLVAITAFGQSNPPNKLRSNDSFTQVDNYLVAAKRLGIPSGATLTLDGSTSSADAPKLFWRTSDSTLHVYVPALSSWLPAGGSTGPVVVPDLQAVTDQGNSTTNNINTSAAVQANAFNGVNASLTGLAQMGSLEVSGVASGQPAMGLNDFVVLSQLLDSIPDYEDGNGIHVDIDNNSLNLGMSFLTGSGSISTPVYLVTSDVSTGMVIDPVSQSFQMLGGGNSRFNLNDVTSVSGSRLSYFTTGSGAYDTTRGITLSESIGDANSGNIRLNPDWNGSQGTLILNPDSPATLNNDLEMIRRTQGLILKSPDDSRWKITVDNSGALVITAL